MRRHILVAVCLFASVATRQAVAQANVTPDNSQPSLLSRQYREGETLAYHMKATNRGRSSTIRYEAYAKGTVKRNATGFVEEYAWSNLNFNGQAIALPASDFRQMLSLDPGTPPGLPDFSPLIPCSSARWPIC